MISMETVEFAMDRVIEVYRNLREDDDFKDYTYEQLEDLMYAGVYENDLIYYDICRDAFEQLEDVDVFEAIEVVNETLGYNPDNWETLYNGYICSYIINNGLIEKCLSDYGHLED